MNFLNCLILFVFGALIGSFLNVVILRFNTGMSVAKGRSACFSCGKALKWYELLPIGSFVAQKGKCRGCNAKISWQYPVVEFAGGLAFVLAYTTVPGAFNAGLALVAFLLTAALLCLYIVITVYDVRHKIIPDFFSYSAGLVALGLIAVQWAMTGVLNPWQLVAGPALFLFFWFFWKVSKGTWMGLGDGKLALSIGWATGFSAGIAALLMSFWIGSIVSLLIIGLQRLFKGTSRLGMKSQIPFGPFLVLGFLIVLIWRVDIQIILSYLTV